MAFWDTSAIVPLCVSQPATRIGRRLLAQHRRMVVWWGTSVEVRSALARLVREGAITSAELSQARSRLAAVRRSWAEVLPTERVRSLAETLPEADGLNAADALQMAAALVWCNERPRNRPFVCFDRDLAGAASKMGFMVIPSKF